MDIVKSGLQIFEALLNDCTSRGDVSQLTSQKSWQNNMAVNKRR